MHFFSRPEKYTDIEKHANKKHFMAVSMKASNLNQVSFNSWLLESDPNGKTFLRF